MCKTYPGCAREDTLLGPNYETQYEDDLIIENIGIILFRNPDASAETVTTPQHSSQRLPMDGILIGRQ